MERTKKISFVNFKGKPKTISEKKWNISLMLPVGTSGDITYCTLDDVKTMCKNNKLCYTQFCEWITGQTCPIVNELGPEKCYEVVYSCDVESWVYHMILNKPFNVLEND